MVQAQKQDNPDRRWLLDHITQIMQEYGNSYVAINSARVVASRTDLHELHAEVRKLKKSGEISGRTIIAKADKEPAIRVF